MIGPRLPISPVWKYTTNPSLSNKKGITSHSPHHSSSFSPQHHFQFLLPTIAIFLIGLNFLLKFLTRKQILTWLLAWYFLSV